MRVQAKLHKFSFNGDALEHLFQTQEIGYMTGQLYLLEVKTNWKGGLKYKFPWLFKDQPSVNVCLACGLGFIGEMTYNTISDFLGTWDIQDANTRYVPLPLLRKRIGGGDAFAVFAERLPLWFKALFNGCVHRREWWNQLVVFVPRSHERATK